MKTLLKTKKDIRLYCDTLNTLYGTAPMHICEEKSIAFGTFTTYYTSNNIPVLQQNNCDGKVTTYALTNMKPVKIRKAL